MLLVIMVIYSSMQATVNQMVVLKSVSMDSGPKYVTVVMWTSLV